MAERPDRRPPRGGRQNMVTQDVPEGAGVDDDIANYSNSSGQHLPSLTSFTYPHSLHQDYFDANASDFTAGNSSCTIQPDVTQNRSQHQVQEYRRNDHVETTPFPPYAVPRTEFVTTRYQPILSRDVQRTVQPPIDVDLPQPHGVRRDASQFDTNLNVARPANAPHEGIPGVAGHYARAAPHSSFAYTGNAAQSGTTTGPSNAFQHTLHGLPNFTSDPVGFVRDWTGVSHARATRGRSRSNATVGPTDQSPMRRPSFRDAYDPRSDALGTTSGSVQGLHWPTSMTRSHEAADALLSLPPSSQLARPAGYRRMSSYSSDEQLSSGGIARQEPGYTPGLLPSFTNQQFAPPATTSSETRSRSRQPSLDIQTQSSYHTLPSTRYPRSGNTGYSSPYATPDPANPSVINNPYLAASSLSETNRYPSMSISDTHGEGSFVHPPRDNTSRPTKTKTLAPFAARKPPSNPTQHWSSGQTLETFTSPYSLSRTPPSGAGDVLRSFPSASSSSSRVLSRGNPYEYSYNEEQVYPGFTSQGGTSGHIEQSVGPASGDSGIHTSISSSVYEQDPDLGLVPNDLSGSLFVDPVQAPFNSQFRFAPASEYTQGPSLTVQDPNSTPRIEQRIVTEYMEYQAPVILYEIIPETTGCHYAQAWLENVISQYPPSPTLLPTDAPLPKVNSRSYHSTEGFIFSGNALSLLVLHNATDPWAQISPYAPGKGTTSIGTYGYHWFKDDWIHWVTSAPSLETWLSTMGKKGYIKKVREWRPDMQPREKRFHKAYWVAANRKALGGLLRRAPVTGADPNAVEDDEFPEITMDSLDSDCGSVSAEDAKDAWDVVMGVAQGIGVTNVDHVVCGDPEEPLYEQMLRFDRLVRVTDD